METETFKIGQRVCGTGAWDGEYGTVVSIALPGNPDMSEIVVDFDNGMTDTAPSKEFRSAHNHKQRGRDVP